MTLDPQLVNAIFSGLVLLLGAVGTLVATRGRRAAVDRREHRKLQRRYIAALRHIFRLETELAELGHQPPARPELLDDEDDDGGDGRAVRGVDPSTLPPTPQPVIDRRGRHGAP